MRGVTKILWGVGGQVGAGQFRVASDPIRHADFFADATNNWRHLQVPPEMMAATGAQWGHMLAVYVALVSVPTFSWVTLLQAKMVSLLPPFLR